MIGLDTNVVVRYLREDDEAQAAKAAALIDLAIKQEETLFVSHIVLCEVVWVLTAGYRLSKAEVLMTVRSLLSAAQLVLEDPDEVRRALARYEVGKGDFADCLIGGRAVARGCDRIATFDKALLNEPEFFSP